MDEKTKNRLKAVIASAFECLMLAILTYISFILSRREQYTLSGIFLMLAGLCLYIRNVIRERSLLSPPGLLALGLIGGEGIACLHLSALGTVWTVSTWLSFYLGFSVFYIIYTAVTLLLPAVLPENAESIEESIKGKKALRQISSHRGGGELLSFILSGLLIVGSLCFILESTVLGFIPFFTVDTPHAYSSFHLPGIHYFTTLVVIAPSVAILYFNTSIKENGGRIKKSFVILTALGTALPWLLTILMVSRFQFLFSVILMIFTAYLAGLRISRKQIFAIMLGMLVVYIVLSIERAHSVEYLNGIFEMKDRSTPIFITQPYMYIANNYDNFNMLTEGLKCHSRGMRMLYPFATLSGLKYFIELPFSFPLYITKEELTTLTLLYDAYYDFGIYGVIGFSAVLGGSTGLLSIGIQRSGNPFALLIGAQMCFYLVFSFFTTWFSNPSTMFYLGWSVIFCLSYGFFTKNRIKTE